MQGLSFRLPPLLRVATCASAAAAVLALTLWAHASTSFRRASFSPEEDLLYLPKPEVLRILSLGQTELVADLVWVRSVVYAGGEMGKRGQMRWLDRYMQTIFDLDPTFRRPYKWAGVISMYNGRAITNEMVRQSTHYLERGAANFPNDWEFPFMLGCNYFNELKTHDPAQKEAWITTAAEYIRRAATLGGGPSWMPILAATIYTRGGQIELAVRHLEEIYASTEDPRVRDDVRAKLLQLRAQAETEHLERGRAEFEQRWHAWAPYVPLDLYVIVGTAPPDTDLKTLIERAP